VKYSCRVQTTSLGTPYPSTTSVRAHTGVPLMRKRHPLGPYCRTMPRALWWSYRGGRFLMIGVALRLAAVLDVTNIFSEVDRKELLQGYLDHKRSCYRGTSLRRKRTPLGPYRRPVLGGWAFSYGRGTPVRHFSVVLVCC